MRRKPTYQELANATLAKTQLGAVTLPYVPYNDNALAIKALRAMTDRLALEARVNQQTQAQVFATAAETGLPPQTVQGMVNHTEQQNRLLQALSSQMEQNHVAQNIAQTQNTGQIVAAIGAQAQAQQSHLNTMQQVNANLRGSMSSIEQAAAAMAGHTGSIGPQITARKRFKRRRSPRNPGQSDAQSHCGPASRIF